MAFRVPHTLEELALGIVGEQDAGEALDLAAMLQPLTPYEANLRQAALTLGDVTNFGPEDEGHLYMCRHWDEETRLCAIYEDRPPMCRTFPYGEPCRYGCSCQGVKPGPEVIV